jgi:DNA invertase Pin-like site-specific DNA recombinase
MPRCFILNRVSTERQKDNLSISVQRDLHPRIADQLGCTYTKADVFDLDVSSTTYDREKWNAVKAAIASGRYANGYGIFGSIDRYHRDKDEWFEFLTHCLRQKITVVIPDTVASIPKGQQIPIEEYNPDKFKDLIQLVFEIEEAENFKRKLRAKVKRALSHARASGIDLGATGLPTLGVSWDSKPQVSVGGHLYGKWKVRKDQEALVRMIITTPLSNVQMAKLLNQKGYKNVLGHNFDTNSVSRIRKRLRYAGKMTNDSGDIIDALNVEPIVTYEQLQAAAKYGKRQKEYRGRGAKYKMIGLVKCGICISNGLKGQMVRKSWLNSRPEQVRMYCDSTRYLPRERRCIAFSKGVSGDRLFDLIVLDLQSKFENKRFLQKALDDYSKRMNRSKTDGQEAALRKRLSGVEKKLGNLTRAVSEGFDASLAVREMNRLKDERAAINDELNALHSTIAPEIPSVKDLQRLSKIFFDSHIKSLPDDQVNAVMKALIDSVHYFVDHIIVNYRYFGSTMIPTPYIDYRFRANRSPLYKGARKDPVPHLNLIYHRSVKS